MSRIRTKTASQNRFASIPQPDINRSLFKRQFGNKFTLDEGKLVPIHVSEIYAGDTLNASMNSFIRLTTPISPVMDGIEFDLHAFFVPSRLVMEDYYKMLGEQTDPDDSVNVLIPQINATTFAENSLADYFGLPTKIAIPQEDMPIALPFRCYSKIFNDWYRDQNLQDSLVEHKGTTNDNISDYSIQRRNKKHDYFTSCLPNAQKGSEVLLPLGDEAKIAVNVTGNESLTVLDGNGDISYVNTNSYGNVALKDGTTTATNYFYADLSNATAASINDIRNAISIQHILERRMRSGTRDVEILQSQYGVSPTDDRLQRPELIGTSRSNLTMTTVAQTSSTDATSPLGELSAIGTINADMNFTYSAVENGFLMILASARADVSYQQGMARMWSKRTYLDVLDPMRANIGEQPVYRKEIFMSDNTEENNTVFGYLPNFDDLRFGQNLITGQFRSNATNSLDQWHFSQEFANAPVLSAEFIKQDSPVDRVLAVSNNPDFYGDMYLKVNHYRVLPVYGTPGLTRF
jgi:hypothetical protein